MFPLQRLVKLKQDVINLKATEAPPQPALTARVAELEAALAVAHSKAQIAQDEAGAAVTAGRLAEAQAERLQREVESLRQVRRLPILGCRCSSLLLLLLLLASVYCSIP